MSFFSSSFSSSSYSSFSSSSFSSNGWTTGQSYMTQSSSGPNGTSVRTISQNLGGPAVEETRHYDSQGREMLAAPPARSAAVQRRIQDIEVEDVTEEFDKAEAEKKYRAAMKDEYAKREGGA